MDEGFPFLEIIFLAMAAGVILFRLHSVLGRRTGHERQPPESFGADENRATQDDIIKAPSGADGLDAQGDRISDLEFAPDTPLGRELQRIVRADPRFEPGAFLTGARAAYEIIVEAFAAGDRDRLRPLLGDEVFQQFSAAISEREKDGLTSDTRVIEIVAADLDRANLRGATAEITVLIESDLLSATRNRHGVIVCGNASDAERVREIWTFARDTESRNPNWLVISTQSED